MGLGPQGEGVGVASPGPKDQWQKEPTCRPSLGLASPSHPAWGLAETARRSLAPGTKCSARRPPGFRDFEAHQRGRAGGEAGGHQMPVGPRCRQHKHGLSLPASVSSLPYILLACPPPPRAGRWRRPGLGPPDMGRAGSHPCLAPVGRTPRRPSSGLALPFWGPSLTEGLPQPTHLVAVGPGLLLGPPESATDPPCPVDLLLPQASLQVHAQWPPWGSAGPWMCWPRQRPGGRAGG